MIFEIRERVWNNEHGRVLVRVSDAKLANVIPSGCTADELRDLAEACCAAADAMDAMAEVKAE